MEIELRERTAEHVKIWFERTNDPMILAGLPRSAQTVEQALADFERSLEPDAASFGRTVYADGQYVGDVWCYCIHGEEQPDAMLSYGIFETDLWGRGVASEAVGKFLKEAVPRFSLQTMGAFTYMDNPASVRVLEKNGFRQVERFQEDGRLSCYCELSVPDGGRVCIHGEVMEE